MGFVILVNQLINHLDKLEVMSDGEWKPNVIVRVGKGSDEPLDLPSTQSRLYRFI